MPPSSDESVQKELGELKTLTAVQENEIKNLKHSLKDMKESTDKEFKEILDRIEDQEDKTQEKIAEVFKAVKKGNKNYETLRWLIICYVLVTLNEEVNVGTLFKLLVGL